MPQSLAYAFNIGLCSLLLFACQPKIVNQFQRQLTPQEIETLAQELEAEVIETTESPSRTFILWDNPSEGLLTGYYSALVIEFDNGKTGFSINKSTYNSADDPQKKVSIFLSETNYQKIGESRSEDSLRYGQVAMVVRDPKILQQMKSTKLTFLDKRQTVIPSQGKKGILFQYDSADQDCCSKIELLSKSGEVLYSKNRPF